MQIENEYGAFGYDDFPRDTAYLESLKDALGQFGIESLLFTSDSPKGTQDFGSIPGGIYISQFRIFLKLFVSRWREVYSFLDI